MVQLRASFGKISLVRRDNGNQWILPCVAIGVPFLIASRRPGKATKKGPFQAERGMFEIQDRKVLVCISRGGIKFQATTGRSHGGSSCTHTSLILFTFPSSTWLVFGEISF